MSSLTRLLHRAFCTAPQATATVRVKAIVNELHKERKLKSLVEKFKKSSEIDRFRTKTGIYEHTVRLLASAKQFKWIEEILEEQKKYRDISREGFSVRLIALYGKAGMLDNARKVFDEMPERNCKRTVLSFNALLAACINAKKFDKFDEFFRELPSKLSIEPDLISYNTAIKGFCKMGSLDLVLPLLDDMEKKGVEPDLITFNTVLNGLYANRRFLEGEKIWARMKDKNVIPDIRTYNARLLGLASEKKAKEAVDLVEDMRSKGIKPDIYSFNVLIRSFVGEGDLEGAKKWYSEIGKSDFDPDKITFNTLVPFACEKGDLDFAFELFKDIFNCRCLVNEELLQLVVDSLVKGSKIEEAKGVVQLGKTNKYRRYKLKLKLPSDQ